MGQRKSAMKIQGVGQCFSHKATLQQGRAATMAWQGRASCRQELNKPLTPEQHPVITYSLHPPTTMCRARAHVRAQALRRDISPMGQGFPAQHPPCPLAAALALMLHKRGVLK